MSFSIRLAIGRLALSAAIWMAVFIPGVTLACKLSVFLLTISENHILFWLYTIKKCVLLCLKGSRLIFGLFGGIWEKDEKRAPAGFFRLTHLILLMEAGLKLGLSISIRKCQFDGSRISRTMKESKHNDFVFFY